MLRDQQVDHPLQRCLDAGVVIFIGFEEARGLQHRLETHFVELDSVHGAALRSPLAVTLDPNVGEMAAAL
jgi:hypothetical protein